MDEKLERYFFEKTKPEFQQLAIVLHELILDAHPDIKVSSKWQMPAYDYKGSMIEVGAFKEKVTVFFRRGAEMKDPIDWFVGQEESKTIRSIQIKSKDEIPEELPLYIENAVKVNDAGKAKVKKAAPKPLPEIPQELLQLLKDHPEANEFFQSLNKTHKREYIVWITSAKREETKNARLAKTKEKLLANQTCWNQYKK